MPLTIHTDPVPLRSDEHGAVRVGDTRILFDIVIWEFQNGACPEDIVSGYPTLQLADVYAVLAYYLRHREEVDKYLQEGEEEAERLRREIEADVGRATSLDVGRIASVNRASGFAANASPIVSSGGGRNSITAATPPRTGPQQSTHGVSRTNR